jgi:hypothetical protein
LITLLLRVAGVVDMTKVAAVVLVVIGLLLELQVAALQQKPL